MSSMTIKDDRGVFVVIPLDAIEYIQVIGAVMTVRTASASFNVPCKSNETAVERANELRAGMDSR